MGAFGFPAYHIIGYLFDDFAGITHHKAARRNLRTFFNKTQGTDNALIAQHHPIHYYGIHPHEAVFSYFGSMYNGSMANMCSGFQQNRNAGKHMNGTVFLHIATIFQYYATPVATQSSTRPNIAVCAYNHIAGNGSLRMYKCSGMHHRNICLVLIKHSLKLFWYKALPFLVQVLQTIFYRFGNRCL